MNTDRAQKMIIAIDGPAASGKGSLAKKLAEALNYDFLDTGALYRRVALRVFENCIDPYQKDDVIIQTEQLSKELNQKYDDSALRNDKIGSIASIIAQIPEVRSLLFDFQRNFSKNSANGAVLDGRDIGTVICPDADIKLFVTASTKKRAERRYKELQSRGIDAISSSVLAEMQERDRRDAMQLDKHLKPGRDVHIIDTSDMTPQAVLDAALKIITDHRS